MNLAEATTGELVDELARRSGGGVFVAILGSAESVRATGMRADQSGQFAIRVLDNERLFERTISLVACALAESIDDFAQRYGRAPNIEPTSEA